MAEVKQDKSGRSLLGRRDLLSKISWAGALGVAGGLGLLALRTLWPRAGRASALRLNAGAPEDYQVGQVGLSLLARHGVFVVRSEEGFYALSASCTHLGCRLAYAPGQREFQCNCHGSGFSLQGKVLRGPAPRTLERVLITLEQGQLKVDPKVRYRRELGDWQQAGAFVRYGGSRGGKG